MEAIKLTQLSRTTFVEFNPDIFEINFVKSVFKPYRVREEKENSFIVKYRYKTQDIQIKINIILNKIGKAKCVKCGRIVLKKTGEYVSSTKKCCICEEKKNRMASKRQRKISVNTGNIVGFNGNLLFNFKGFIYG